MTDPKKIELALVERAIDVAADMISKTRDPEQQARIMKRLRDYISTGGKLQK